MNGDPTNHDPHDAGQAERWVIVLRDAGGSEQPLGRRVAGCLKAMLRAWRLRCESCSTTSLLEQLAASRTEVLHLQAEIERLKAHAKPKRKRVTL